MLESTQEVIDQCLTREGMKMIPTEDGGSLSVSGHAHYPFGIAEMVDLINLQFNYTNIASLYKQIGLEDDEDALGELHTHLSRCLMALDRELDAAEERDDEE